MSRQNRYPLSLVVRVRQLHDGGKGMGPTAIQRLLAEEGAGTGPVPSLGTIRCWAIPSHAEAHLAFQRETDRRRRARGGQPMWSSGRLVGEALDNRMLELRSLGLAYPAIAAVVNRYHGATLTEHQIRPRLNALGVEPLAIKVLNAKRQAARRREHDADRQDIAA